MNLLTHVFMSRVLYNQLKGQISLEKRLFMYGNIKPDLEFCQKPHTVHNYLAYVNEKANLLMDKEYDVRAFSIKLGEICHYVCDFFCQYHFNEDLCTRHMEHFIYEMKIHTQMKKLVLENKLGLNHKEGNEYRKDISSLIKKMQENYFANKASLTNDILFSLDSCKLICESIAHYSYSNSINHHKRHQLNYRSVLLEGGYLK